VTNSLFWTNESRVGLYGAPLYIKNDRRGNPEITSGNDWLFPEGGKIGGAKEPGALLAGATGRKYTQRPEKHLPPQSLPAQLCSVRTKKSGKKTEKKG